MSRDPSRDAPGSFWARRRAAVEAEERAEAQARRAEEAAEHDAKLAERTDEEILEDLGLPDPDEMESTEQVQSLLREAVPQRLKARALRRLWRLNPVLANVDGLVDYGEDFTDAAMVVENMQTAYQVGKGMLKTLVQDEPETEETAEEPDAPEAAADADPEVPEAQEDPQDEPEAEPYRHAYADEEPGDAPTGRTPRRMRFAFDR